jgi:hypothetical protein
MVSSHPVVEYNHFHRITKQLAALTVDEDTHFLLMDSLSELCTTLTPEKVKAALIYGTFESLLLKKYFLYEEEIVTILHYCLKSDFQVGSQFYPLFVKSLNSSVPHLPEKTLALIDLLFAEEEQVTIIWAKDNLMGLLVAAYGSAGLTAKIRIVRLMAKTVHGFLVSAFKEEGAGHADIFSRILHTLKDAL